MLTIRHIYLLGSAFSAQKDAPCSLLIHFQQSDQSLHPIEQPVSYWDLSTVLPPTVPTK